MHVVECDADVALVRVLTSLSRRRVVCVVGRSQVLKKLIRKYTDSIGMIDQDPHTVHSRKYIERFREVEYPERFRLKVLHHNRSNNRLIVLCPRLEEWIIAASGESNIHLNRYNLSHNPEQLHAIINIKTDQFQRLVKELMQSSQRVQALRDLLRERTRRSH